MKTGNHRGRLHRPLLASLLLLLAAGTAAPALAAGLFAGRDIHLRDDANRRFTIGVTGTTAGRNYIALVANAVQEAVALGALGFWERVPDPPTYLRNTDLQLIVINQQQGQFRIGFTYNPQRRDIDYEILEGRIRVEVNRQAYYPELIVKPARETAASAAVGPPADNGRQHLVFFDFNSFDSDLRRYYGRVKRLLRDPAYQSFFYYYASGNYNDYYFKTYRNTDQLDTAKMGLSLEDGSLEYYQKILDNLKSRHGTDFAAQITIVSRFGTPYADQLRAYARDIGLSRTMAVDFISYEDMR
jgi:hypothetical protein